MLKGQSIESGNHSVNVQGKEVTFVQNNSGISYSDAKDIAMNVFKSNFYDLGEKVEGIVNARAEKLVDNYLEKLLSTSPESIKNTENPDIRYVIYEAQKNHARRNDENIEKLLVETLVERTVSKANSSKELILNESLSIIPKLTSNHIDILSLIFLITSGGFNTEIDIEIFIKHITDIASDLTIAKKHVLYEYLDYTSCLSISSGSIDFRMCLVNKFPNLKDTSNIKKFIESNEELSNLNFIWNNTPLKHCRLTSVGIAIAIFNIAIKTHIRCDLDSWIG